MSFIVKLIIICQLKSLDVFIIEEELFLPESNELVPQVTDRLAKVGNEKRGLDTEAKHTRNEHPDSL